MSRIPLVFRSPPWEHIINLYAAFKNPENSYNLCGEVCDGIIDILSGYNIAVSKLVGSMWDKNEKSWSPHIWLHFQDYYIDFTASQFGYTSFPKVMHVSRTHGVYEGGDVADF